MSATGTVTMRDTRPAAMKALQPFVVGGTGACVATCVVQPIDMVKVRIQLASDTGGSTNPFKVLTSLVRNEGVLRLYKGLDAGLIRQLTYSTARLGLFRVISDGMKKPEEKTLPLHKKAAAGLAAGGLASLIGNPADLTLIRLQADATLPVNQRRNYTGALNAMSRIVREEGLLALWRGSTPTMARAMALNMGMLASFDQAKEMLAKTSLGTGMGCTLTASAISGFFAVTFSLPFDLMKTKIQKMKADPVTGELPYKNLGDCFVKTFKYGGIRGFYTGYLTYYVRVAPHAMVTLIFIDWANKLIKKKFI